MTDTYIGLGSNLDHPLEQIQTALKNLKQVPATELIASSACYQTAPLGGLDQPAYVNAVAHLNTELGPEALLSELQRIENVQGRQRSEQRWQARTLDLDLLLYGNKVIDTPDLKIPHYAMAERNFVIFPLLELNPELSVPGFGEIRKLAARLSREGLIPVEP